MEATTEPGKHVLECENGIGFVSEAVKVDAFGESEVEIDTQEEPLNVSEGSREVEEGTVEGEDNFVSELAEVDEEEIEVLDCEKEDGKDCLMEGLPDDDDWEGIEVTELEKDFGKAVCFLEYKSNADKDFKLGNDLKMQLYGLHKIATEGSCYEPQPMSLELSARAKWNAWKKLGNMSPEAAMELYITLVSSNIPGFDQEDVCGNAKQDCADAKASRELPSDVKTMAVNQAIDVDYRTSNELTAHIQSTDGIKSSAYTP
ncbi:hypothetical protein V6N13_112252 [Hibiscus sabdariffa]|uniref:ACB domain-containing protein n=1 Tax=Hibiscus sabdariffa TaxID=183260 RepID=A0ABR2TN50_9ROSI